MLAILVRMTDREKRLNAMLGITGSAIVAYMIASLLNRVQHAIQLPAVSGAVLAVITVRPTSERLTQSRFLQLFSVPLIVVGLALMPLDKLSRSEFDYLLLGLTIVATSLQMISRGAAMSGQLIIKVVMLALIAPPFVSGTIGHRGLVAYLTTTIAAVCVCLIEYLLASIFPQQKSFSTVTPTATPRDLPLLKRSSVRRSIQLCIAVAIAILVGQWLFPSDSHWMVLSVFIVGAGAISRGHAFLKGFERLAGACIGTVFGALLVHFSSYIPSSEVLVFTILGVVSFWRPTFYWAWAVGTTLLASMLHLVSSSGSLQLGLRLEEIVAGSAIAIVISYFILPIKTRRVLQKYAWDAWKASRQALQLIDGPHKLEEIEALHHADESLHKLQTMMRSPAFAKAPHQHMRVVASDLEKVLLSLHNIQETEQHNTPDALTQKQHARQTLAHVYQALRNT